MKKWIFLIFFLTLLFLLSCSKNDLYKYSISNKSKTITIEIIKDEKQENMFLNYIKDFSGSIVALIGIIAAWPFFRRKMIENHISNTLFKIQEVNRIVGKECQKLIDKYISYTYTIEPISRNELESIYKDINNLYLLSVDGSSDVTTVIFYLKVTIQRTLKHYNKKYTKTSFITSREIYELVIKVIETVIFYSTKVIQIPKSSKVNQYDLIEKTLKNNSIKNYISNSSFTEFKHFNQGVLFDFCSLHYLSFYAMIIKSNTLITRSAFSIYINPDPVLKLLQLNEIYAPLILEDKNKDELFNVNYSLFLIKFSINDELTMANGKRKKIVNLYYTNTNDISRFVSHLKPDYFKSNFIEKYIIESEFNFENILSFGLDNFETIVIKFEYAYLQNAYKVNKKRIEIKLKENYAESRI